MKKEWLLTVGVVVVTLLVSLGVIRWQAPGLLGIQSDLQLVQVSKKVPPFYEGVFRRKDITTDKFILSDPYTRTRGRPLWPAGLGPGPNDILGFRNLEVPDVSDVVVLGDSQTYGINEMLPFNWPNQMKMMLAGKNATVYAMATDGWSAIQYLYMVKYATLFKPRVIVIAYYTGNDPLECFMMAYGDPQWKQLRPDHSLSSSDLPKVSPKIPNSERWEVTFKDGITTTFTPKYRLASNQDTPVVHAGYEIMLSAAQQIADIATQRGVHVIFTIIPTKELVYARKVESEKLHAPPDYERLIVAEKANIERLAKGLIAIKNADYIDLVNPLQKTAMGKRVLYRRGIDGHPAPGGYEVIARTLTPAVGKYLPGTPLGLVAVHFVKGDNRSWPLLAKRNGTWLFANNKLIMQNGWDLKKITTVSPRDVATLPLRGVIDHVDPSIYGPESLK